MKKDFLWKSTRKLNQGGSWVPWRKYHTIWFVMAFGWVALYVVRMGISPVLGMIMEEFHVPGL